MRSISSPTSGCNEVPNSANKKPVVPTMIVNKVVMLAQPGTAKRAASFRLSIDQFAACANTVPPNFSVPPHALPNH
ncbi:hypothetical protein AKJ16_DCAP25083 [Drosera capensis]